MEVKPEIGEAYKLLRTSDIAAQVYERLDCDQILTITFEKLKESGEEILLILYSFFHRISHKKFGGFFFNPTFCAQIFTFFCENLCIKIEH